jgi:hypothetical protein
MRLLHCTELRLEEFLGHSTPEYTILSHTWAEDEISLQDMEMGKSHISRMKGYSKLKGCCDLAAQDGFEWVWIDNLLHVVIAPLPTMPYNIGGICRRFRRQIALAIEKQKPR